MKINYLIVLLAMTYAFIHAAERPEYKGSAASALQEMKGQRTRYYPAQLPSELHGEIVKFYKDFSQLKKDIQDISVASIDYLEKLTLIGKVISQPQYAYLEYEPELVEEILKYINSVMSPSIPNDIYYIAFYADSPIFDNWIKHEVKKNNAQLLAILRNAIRNGSIIAESPEFINEGIHALKIGASPNIRHPDNSTPLHLAAKNNNVPMVAALLQAGADPNARNDQDKTALDWALERNEAEGGYDEVIALLKDSMNK